MPGDAGWATKRGAAVLAFVLGVGGLVPVLARRARKAVLAMMVVGSVAFVGYLPTTITASPGKEVTPPPERHSTALSAIPVLSTEGVTSLLSDCTSCHQVGDESMAVRQFPPIPHRVEGWEECSFCHAPARLAPPPEGHTGVPDMLCQACHKVSTTSPPSLGHVLWRDKTCSSCHRTSLDLPVSHEDRGDLTCALCHEPPKVEPPVVPHSLSTEELCAGCHPGDEAASTEPRHSDWMQEECTTCHSPSPGGVPTVPHEMDSRTECSFCHTASPDPTRPGLQLD
jgi:hypothetical protein